ncbi:AraC family transcriptional regulator [Paenibacillus sp. FSL R7-0272]|uniref:helix-turn-helix transcriptional regulator n=1 Tax=Paenibacillus sp. FSL R7-0272 TaxID=2921679 RepID=UPI0030ED84B8
MNSFTGNTLTQRSVPFILHESRHQFDWKGQGALSLKTFRYGTSLYEAGHGHFAVDQDRYLLLNEGQEYQLHIDSPVPVESFCIFFPSGLVEEIGRNISRSHQYLLDEPYATSSLGTLDWMERTYPMTDQLGAALERLRSSYASQAVDVWGLEEQLYHLGVHMLVLHREIRLEIDSLDMVKSSTRNEIYRRIYIAHEYMTAYYNKPITLAETASAAHLSVNHFLRSYKKVFGISPHQFLTERRLQAACQLLSNSDLPVTEICYNVGFESLGSFSSLFSRRFKHSPAQHRIKR